MSKERKEYKEYKEYAPLDAIGENLSENGAKLARAFELRFGELDSLCRFSDSEAELLRLNERSLRHKFALKPEENAPKPSCEAIEMYSEVCSLADHAMLCRTAAEKNCGGLASVLGSLEPEQNEEALAFDPKIAYRKAPGADIAYEKFASVLPDASAHYCESFREVCESVKSGDAALGILPHENSEDGKLMSFVKLIDEFELRIVAACEVVSRGRGDATRYILIGNELSLIAVLTGITTFEFELNDRGDGALSRVLSGASLLGLGVERLDTVGFSDGGIIYDVRLATDQASLEAYVRFLELESVSFIPLGVYTELI